MRDAPASSHPSAVWRLDVEEKVDPRHLLGNIPLLSQLSGEELDAVHSLGIRVRYGARQVVVTQGDPGGDMFAILSGHLKVIASGEDNRDVMLAIMGPGEVFGEVGLFDGEVRSASVIALESTELLLIGRTAFLGFLERSPQTAIKLLEILARRLRVLSSRTGDVAFLAVSERLAKQLLELADQHGVPDSNGVRIHLKFSQQELGEMVGATRESINKQLRNWVHAGLIKQDGGHIVLTDVASLRSLAMSATYASLAAHRAQGT